jgi:hypothetical protein
MTAPATSSARPAFLGYGDFRDHLAGQKPPGRSRYCTDIASRCLTAAAQHMADLYETGGAMAVADAAYVPGGPGRGEIAARYEALIGRAAA